MTAPNVTTKADFVHDMIRKQILSGEISPGQRMRQEHLANQLGASITPLREAIRRLQTEGLVLVEAHKDAVVAPLSKTELRELFETRMPLDGQSAALAAIRRTDADLENIRAALTSLQSHPSAESTDVVRMNFDFHQAVWVASHNHILIGMLDSLWARSERYRRLGALIHVRDDVHDVHQQEHVELAAAIANRDAEQARDIMTRHTQGTLTDLSSRLTDGPDEVPHG